MFERMRTQDQQNLLVHELNHRTKNILAVVQAVAQQTIPKATSTSEAYESFKGRLQAISKAQDLLVFGSAEDATLDQLIAAGLAGSGASLERVSIVGPQVRLPGTYGATFSLATHELCTNAFKYGALSNAEGRVTISWNVHDTREGAELMFEWREFGGPPVQPPTRKGFGTTLLEQALRKQLGGTMELTFDISGFVCKFSGLLPATHQR